MPTPLRTLQIVNVRWFNATAWYGIELADILNKSGNESLVVGLEGTESFAKAHAMGLDPIALPLNTVNPIHLAGLVWRMDTLLQRFQPDVVNCHRGESFALWAGLKARHGFALVRTRGDQRLPKNNLPNRLLHRTMADALVATNTVMARHFVEHLHVPPQRVHTIVGGVDSVRFHFDPAGRQAVRARYGLTDEHCVLGLLGRFDQVKGQKETLEAVAQLIKEGRSHIRLLLLGFPTTTSQSEVQGWIRELGIEQQVIITGKVPDVTAHISALDVGVVASLWSETIARAALEIMACGRPLASTSVGVMPDLLPSEALATPGDAPAFTALLRTATSDTAWQKRLATHAVERIRHLRTEDFCTQTLAVYAQALKRRRDAGP